MKLSCLPVSLFNDIIDGRITIKEWARIGKSIGLDAVDFSMLFIKAHNPVYLREINDALDSEGMEIAMITTYPDSAIPIICKEKENWNI